MNNTKQLYKEYALINNILLTAEGERDMSEYSIRSSVPTEQQIRNELSSSNVDDTLMADAVKQNVANRILKFRGPQAQKDWEHSVVFNNQRRLPVMSKTNTIRNLCQAWMDGARFRLGIVNDRGEVLKGIKLWTFYAKKYIRGEYKGLQQELETMSHMFAEVVVRLDSLEGGVENQQESQARIEARAAQEATATRHIGFNSRY